jgi:hypothetical protein
MIRVEITLDDIYEQQCQFCFYWKDNKCQHTSDINDPDPVLNCEYFSWKIEND